MCMQALTELHFFLLQHPEIDINQYLSAASEQFRMFINKGLSRIRANLASRADPSLSAAGLHTSHLLILPKHGSELNVVFLLMRPCCWYLSLNFENCLNKHLNYFYGLAAFVNTTA
jgi:hypothetical protein